MSNESKTARSYRGTLVDDNAVISINLRWLFQLLALAGTLVYSYYRIETRIGKLETASFESSTRINELVNKHIEDEKIRFSRMEKEISWYKEININPFSKKKKK